MSPKRAGRADRGGHAPPRVVRALDELRGLLDADRAAGRRIALVPTMGNLHDGHLELVRRAHGLGDRVVATIFVNPFQFGPSEDFDSYPRTFERDLELLAGVDCHMLFAPEGATVYPHGPDVITRVEVPRLGDILDGESRPGFFRGVATVVSILFNMVQPDVALFGEKDYQQLLVIRRMVADLKMRIRIEGVPTVRDPDGVAMSSRNGYLTAEERARAPALQRALVAARDALVSGSEAAEVEAGGLDALAAAGMRPYYFQVRRQADMEPPGVGDPVIVLAAAWLGRARLIDNLKV